MLKIFICLRACARFKIQFKIRHLSSLSSERVAKVWFCNKIEYSKYKLCKNLKEVNIHDLSQENMSYKF